MKWKGGGEQRELLKRWIEGGAPWGVGTLHETVYVERFRIVREANPGWRSLFRISAWLTPLLLVAYIALLAVTPVRRGLGR